MARAKKNGQTPVERGGILIGIESSTDISLFLPPPTRQNVQQWSQLGTLKR